MGQYKSYKEASLDRQIANLEKEISSLKSKQRYGGDQIKYIRSQSDIITSKSSSSLWTSNQAYIYGVASIIGVNKDKELVGGLTYSLKMNPSSTDLSDISGAFGIRGHDGSREDWLVIIRRTNVNNSAQFKSRLYYDGNMKVSIRFEWLA